MTSKTRRLFRLLAPTAVVLIALLVKSHLSSSAVPAAAISIQPQRAARAPEPALRQPTILKPELQQGGHPITSPRSNTESESEDVREPLSFGTEPAAIVPAQFLSAPPIDLAPRR